ncbi:MAG: hypothetical protein R2771_09030 [Saprospiraceae bacterium]
MIDLIKNRKVKRYLIILGTVGIMVLLYFSIMKKSSQKLATVNIDIVATDEAKLLEDVDVLNYLHRVLGQKFEQQKLSGLDLKKIEDILDESNFISKSEVYVTSNNILHIKCFLNEPIIRVANKSKSDFYIDSTGNAIPLSKRAAAHVPMLCGNFSKIDFTKLDKEGTLGNEVLVLSKKIHNDEFLNALVEQIYINDNQKIILIPKVGNQKLEFGKLDMIDDKLEKIKIFYKTGMTGSGWRKFNTINLEWEGQVVGSSS